MAHGSKSGIKNLMTPAADAMQINIQYISRFYLIILFQCLQRNRTTRERLMVLHDIVEFDSLRWTYRQCLRRVVGSVITFWREICFDREGRRVGIQYANISHKMSAALARRIGSNRNIACIPGPDLVRCLRMA